MVKNQTILHPASVNLGKGDSRYVYQWFNYYIMSQQHYSPITRSIQRVIARKYIFTFF